MATETKEKMLSAEDVARIVEQVLDEREGEAVKKRRDGLQLEDSELAKMELYAEKIGKAVEAALDRHAAKQAEAVRNTAEEKKQIDDKRRGLWGF